MFHRLVWARNLFRKSRVLRWLHATLTQPSGKVAVAAATKYAAEKPKVITVTHGSLHCHFCVPNVERYITLVCPREPNVVRRFLEVIRPGDTLWDIGANFGYYSILAAGAVGTTGSVVSFDPHPDCLEDVLASAGLNNYTWLSTANVALGSAHGVMRLAGAAEGIDGTHRVVKLDAPESGPQFEIQVVRGDDWLKEHPERPPNVLKIDVEGAELDVLTGLSGVLASPTCRAIIVEIHFGILHSTGRNNVPAKIVDMLKRMGFQHIVWLDASHLAAVKE